MNPPPFRAMFCIGAVLSAGFRMEWSKLPAGLGYIARPAEVYGTIQFGEQIDAFMAAATDAEKADLAALADRLWKWTDDGERLVEWLIETDLVEHKEAARVHFLLILLHEMGFA